MTALRGHQEGSELCLARETDMGSETQEGLQGRQEAGLRADRRSQHLLTYMKMLEFHLSWGGGQGPR